MAIIYTGEMIAKLRKRRQWQQERLLDEMHYYSPSLHRLEKGEQLPRADTLKTVLDTLEAPMNEMIYPHLDDQPMGVYALRYRLIQALDNKDLPEAKALFKELSQIKNFKGKVNHQFFLSQQARLMELQGEPPDLIIPITIKGIKQTYEHFNDKSPGNDVLIFEEPELFHTLARCYSRIGKIHEAVRIIEETYEGLQRLPVGERERDTRTLPMLLSLTEFNIIEHNYKRALDVCNIGLDVSATRCFGKSSPELTYLKADILQSLYRKDECNKLLQMVYMSHILLGEKEKALEVQTKVKQKFELEIETYGVENLDIPHPKKIPYAQGEIAACKTIGEMIRTMRTHAKLSIKELSQGICSIANLGKIEKNEIQGHMHYLEPILQRLGRDPLLYCNFFLTKEDFDARELRDSINSLLSQRKFDEASILLKKLKTYKAYKTKANLQFVKRAEAEIFALDHKKLHQETQKMLFDAINVTLPDFDEDKIERYALSLDESIIIRELAVSVMENKDCKRAERIFESLINNLNRRYVDEFEKARVYDSTMSNYTTCLGRLNKRSKALEIIEEAERFNRSRGRLTSLDFLAGNKGYNLQKRGDKENSLLYFILSFYGFSLFANYGDLGNATIAKRLIKEFFGLILD